MAHDKVKLGQQDASRVAGDEPYEIPYLASKHGIMGFTKTIALEVAESGVTVNAICPGYVYTPLVEAQIEAQAKAHGIPRAEAEQEGRALLERFGLADRERDFPDQLSGGQQQRVALIRAIATRPRALLLDEITSALDPELVGEVLDVVRELKAGGMTMLIATHEMAFAADVADRICYLERGRLVEQGTPQQMFGSPRDPRTREFLRRVRAIGAPTGGRRSAARATRTVRAAR